MDRLKYVKLENEDGSYSSSIPLAVDSDHVDVNGIDLTTVVNNKANKDVVISLSNDLDVQTARIDNLAQLEDGSTTGDAELTDIRIDSDGVSHVNAGDSVRGAVTNIQNLVGIKNHTYNIIDIWNDNLYETTLTESCYDNGQGLSSDTNYNTKSFIPTNTFRVYFDEESLIGDYQQTLYLSITVYPKTDYSQVGSRYRYLYWGSGSTLPKTNTMPTENDPLVVPAGHLINITLRKSNMKFGFPFYVDDATAGFELNDKITLTKNQKVSVEKTLYKEYGYKEINTTNVSMTCLEGINIDSNGDKMSLASYNTYYFIAEQDFSMGFEDIGSYTPGYTSTYFSVATFKDKEILRGNFKGRYRNVDNNLPESLEVKRNDVIAFTVGASTNGSTIHCSDTYELLFDGGTLKDSIKLNVDIPKEEKKCYVEYNSSDSIFYIYIPTYVGYVRYDFQHAIFPSSNCNVWKVAFAYAVDDDFQQRFNLTTGGEWELAVHLNGRSDFSGGSAHGDEVFTDIHFFIDGIERNVTEITERESCKKINIVQNSELFDPNDNITLIANHNSEHIWDKEGLQIKQNCIWQAGMPLTDCYMAMHLPAKAVTDHCYLNNDYTVKEISYGASFNVTEAAIFGEESGVYTKFAVTKYPNIQYFLLTDNNGGAYNKCYYKIDCNGHTTTENERWDTITVYNFDINK